jgi:hypothetical protein
MQCILVSQLLPLHLTVNSHALTTLMFKSWVYTVLYFSPFLLNQVSLHCHCISISTYQQMDEAIRNVTTDVTALT